MIGGVPLQPRRELVGIRSALADGMVGTMNGAKRSLLIEDAAVLLGVSRRTVYYRIRQGRLDTMRTLCGSQRVLLASIERLQRQEGGLGLASTVRAAAV